jgi:uncharacterized protein YfbU (UPF0304 family)
MTEINKAPVLTDEQITEVVKEWYIPNSFRNVLVLLGCTAQNSSDHAHYMKVIEQVKGEAYELGYSDAKREFEQVRKETAQEIFNFFEDNELVTNVLRAKKFIIPDDVYTELKQKYGVE